MRSQILERQPHLALVGMHGPPEETGLTLEPVDGWDIEVANQAAVDAGVRYVEDNLAIQFGYRLPSRRTRNNYELWRPGEIIGLTKGRQTVLEVHDRPDATGEYVAIGSYYYTRLLGIAALLGIRSVIGQGRMQVLGNYAENDLTVEFCRDDAGDSRRRIAENEERLRAVMCSVATGNVPDIDPNDFDYFESEMDIDIRMAKDLELDRMDVVLQPFDPIPPHILELLSLPSDGDYVVDYWHSICSGGADWFGGVLRRMPPPMGPERPSARADVTITRSEYSDVQA